jgi:multidrug efflux pump subunit AcrA (membrane-fusion protein)
MRRILIVALPFAALALGFGLRAARTSEADKDKPAEKSTAKTVRVTKGPCKVEVSMKGVLAAPDTTEVRFTPKAWAGPFTIRKVAGHGTAVKKGDVLVELDSEKLDQALSDLETEQRISEVAIRQAETELPVMEKLMPVELAEAERLKKQAVEDQERFEKIDRPHAVESTEESVKSANHWLEYAREELKQLQKMYRNKDLTEETEEIILKRQRHQVEFAEFYVKSAKLARAELMEVTLPRKEISVREAVRKLTLANDKAQGTLPLNVSQKKAALDKLTQELARSRDRFSKLKHDRALTTITAPADGIVFYGRAVNGHFPEGGNNQVAQKLLVGGSLAPEEVFITLVPQKPTLIYATVDEKDLHLLKSGQSARVMPAGYPDRKLAAKVESVNPVRQVSGSFVALVALDAGASVTDLRPAMNCTVKVPVYEKADALLVPTAAVQRDDPDADQGHVYLVEGDDKPRKQAVKLGKTAGSKIEVLDLKEGTTVLAKPEED